MLCSTSKPTSATAVKHLSWNKLKSRQRECIQQIWTVSCTQNPGRSLHRDILCPNMSCSVTEKVRKFHCSLMERILSWVYCIEGQLLNVCPSLTTLYLQVNDTSSCHSSSPFPKHMAQRCRGRTSAVSTPTGCQRQCEDQSGYWDAEIQCRLFKTSLFTMAACRAFWSRGKIIIKQLTPEYLRQNVKTHWNFLLKWVPGFWNRSSGLRELGTILYYFQHCEGISNLRFYIDYGMSTLFNLSRERL